MPLSLRWLAASLLVTSLLLAASGCAIPHGSFARPVDGVESGGSMVAVGGLVPFAAVGGATANDTDFGELADGFVMIPAASYDHAYDDRSYFGVEVSVLNTLTTSSPDDSSNFGLFVNPRWETALSDNFAFTIDGNLGYFQSESGDGEAVGIPYFAPAIGLRTYLPTGFGGLVWSQQLSTGGITVALPGSVAYDLPIPLGGPTLHLFPELRYDPTFAFTTEASGVVAVFSGGLTMMLEL